jgi:hypothetical protein
MNSTLPKGGVKRGGGVSASLLVLHMAERGEGGAITASAMVAVSQGGGEAHRGGPAPPAGVVAA